LTDKELLRQIQWRACRFFWEKADTVTGLVNDRADNRGKDSYTVASIASTGYALASLPIAVEHNWYTHQAAYERAVTTLRFLCNRMPQVRGWYFHFIDKRTGERVWESELSSIDTALLIIGALICGQYFKGTEVQQLAGRLYNRVDWLWMLTNGGEQPKKLTLSHGWKPEGGFLKNNWDSYCELMFMYLLGMGAEGQKLPAQCWDAWQRPILEYKDYRTLWGGPIFIHQMAHGFYNFSSQRDRRGWNYWASSVAATHINRLYCLDHAGNRRTYSNDIWGLNAGDYPGGYKAFAAPGDEDGTVSPTGAVASVIFTPELSTRAAQAMYKQYGKQIWGRFGFGNAFNVDQSWYDTDVIGIDLGMALLSIENARSSLIWRLLASHPSTSRAWVAAGFHVTDDNRALLTAR
jgi:hypothetical protein